MSEPVGLTTVQLVMIKQLARVLPGMEDAFVGFVKNTEDYAAHLAEIRANIVNLAGHLAGIHAQLELLHRQQSATDSAVDDLRRRFVAAIPQLMEQDNEPNRPNGA
jgi:hypothetical protein